jgi:glutamyl/glutaminyl-tRNA synthetase
MHLHTVGDPSAEFAPRLPDVAWRIRYADALQPYSVVRQKNGRPAYMMATMVDDVEMGITHIVRGEDLRATSQTQRSIATLMGGISVGGVPMRRYLDIATHHHPLITDERGEKLSKSAGASSLRDLRANGRSAQWILDMVERYLVEREDLFGETLP